MFSWEWGERGNGGRVKNRNEEGAGDGNSVCGVMMIVIAGTMTMVAVVMMRTMMMALAIRM